MATEYEIYGPNAKAVLSDYFANYNANYQQALKNKIQRLQSAPDWSRMEQRWRRQDPEGFNKYISDVTRSKLSPPGRGPGLQHAQQTYQDLKTQQIAAQARNDWEYARALEPRVQKALDNMVNFNETYDARYADYGTGNHQRLGHGGYGSQVPVPPVQMNYRPTLSAEQRQAIAQQQTAAAVPPAPAPAPPPPITEPERDLSHRGQRAQTSDVAPTAPSWPPPNPYGVPSDVVAISAHKEGSAPMIPIGGGHPGGQRSDYQEMPQIPDPNVTAQPVGDNVQYADAGAPPPNPPPQQSAPTYNYQGHTYAPGPEMEMLRRWRLQNS
jgi:hypothetical protein